MAVRVREDERLHAHVSALPAFSKARRVLSHDELFELLVDDIEMALARAYIGIAAFYDQLTRPEHARFAQAIRHAYELTRGHVLAVKGCDGLLDSEPTLQRSIRLRNPYVDPIHLTQVDLLRRWREAGRPARGDRDLLDALVASVNGISQGLQGAD